MSAVRRGLPPASAWALSLLYVGAAARCLAGAVSTTDPHAQGHLVTAAGVGCVLVAAAVYSAGARSSATARHAALIGVIAVSTLLVATSGSRAGVLSAAFAYPWAGLYAAHFMTRRTAYAYVAMSSAAFAAGITVTGQPDLLGAWALVTCTVLAVTMATAGLVAALRRQSETDPLTGVANRAGFERLAAPLLAAAARQGRHASLVVCDVDGLKEVNDSLGHAAGDALLAGFAAAWASSLRRGDVLARLGGDEFVVLLPETDAPHAQAAVHRLRTSTQFAFSAGVATWVPGEPVQALVARADAAMYACKRAQKRGAVPPVARAAR